MRRKKKPISTREIRKIIKEETKEHVERVSKIVSRYVELREERRKLEKKIGEIVKSMEALEESLTELGYSRLIPAIQRYEPSTKIRKKRSEELSYEMVTEAANEIMDQGRAVSVNTLAEHLNLLSKKDEISRYLHQAVEEGKYEERKRTFEPYAKGRSFSIFSPKGKFLPFPPRDVDTEKYSKLKDEAKSLFVGRELTAKEFYKLLKPIGLKLQMKPMEVAHSKLFILYDLCEEGYLEKIGEVYKIKK
jgi:hypothetical protein